MAAGGGGGGGGGGGTVVTGTSPVLNYSKFRDFSTVATGDPRPIIEADGTGFDAAETDGPAVAVDKSRVDGDFFMMFYEALDGVGTISIGLVTSNEEDFQTTVGATVISRQRVINPAVDDAGLNAFNVHATDPTVIVDRRAGTPPGERYKMWFEGRSGGGGTTSKIVYCESGNGINWTNFTVCNGLNPGTNVSFGSRVADPTVILDQNPAGDMYRMWFEAVDETGDGSSRIGYAESLGGTTWIVSDGAATSGAASAVIFPGFGGAFTNFSVGSPSVVLMEDASDNNLIFHLWYTAGDVPTASGTEDTIGYATSANGLTWLREGTANPFNLPVLKPTSDSVADPTGGGFVWDSGDVRQPSAYIDDNNTPGTIADDAYHLWWAADIENGGPNSPNSIGYAKDLP